MTIIPLPLMLIIVDDQRTNDQLLFSVSFSLPLSLSLSLALSVFSLSSPPRFAMTKSRTGGLMVLRIADDSFFKRLNKPRYTEQNVPSPLLSCPPSLPPPLTPEVNEDNCIPWLSDRT